MINFVNRQSLLALLFVLFFMLSGCQSSSIRSDFFIQSDGYLAVPADSIYTVSLTYYCPKNIAPLDKANITSLQLHDGIQINHFDVSEINTNSASFLGLSFTIELIFPETGVFETDHILLSFHDGTATQYTIGHWSFDVGDQQSPDFMKFYASPVISSNPQAFIYDYQAVNEDLVIDEFWYGNGQYLSSAKEEIPLSGTIRLQNVKAPIVFIRPKAIAQINGVTSTQYLDGCYCGALDIDDADLQYSHDVSISP